MPKNSTKNSTFWSIRTKILVPIIGILAVGLGLVGWISFWVARDAVTGSALQSMRNTLEKKIQAAESFHSKARSDLLLAMEHTVFSDYFHLEEVRSGNRYDTNGVIQFTEKQRTIKNRMDQWVLALQRRFPIVETCVIDSSGQEHMRITNGEIAPDNDFSSTENAAEFFAPTFSIKTGDVYINPPYMSADADKWVFSYTSPIALEDGSRPAFFHYEIPVALFQAILNETQDQQEGHEKKTSRFLLSGPDGLLIGDSSQSIELDRKKTSDQDEEQKLTDYLPPLAQLSDDPAFVEVAERMNKGEKGSGHFLVNGAPSYLVFMPLPTFGWSMGYLMSEEEMLAGRSSLRRIGMTIWAAAISALVVAALVIIGVARHLTRPLRECGHLFMRISEGELSISCESSRRDEIGELLRTLSLMSTRLKGVVSLVSESITHVTHGSEELKDVSHSVSQGVVEQAASMETITSEMGQMATHIHQNSDNAEKTEAIASKAAKTAIESGAKVNQAEKSMEKIADRISAISGIARQTNLLALNAAIEAARAGEHGKGFAVVAAEVRKLADRSQDVATEIAQMSSTSLTTAREASHLMTILVPEINTTATQLRKISEASRHQSENAKHINQAIRQMDQTTQLNASSTEEMSATSDELAATASALQKAMSFFQTNTRP